MRQRETDIRRAKVFVNETCGREHFHGPLQLEHEYRSDRGGNRQQSLGEPRDDIDLVGHLHSPLIEPI